MIFQEVDILRIYMNETDKHKGLSLHTKILESAKSHEIMGASVFKGIEGFGETHIIHTARIVDAVSHMPILIEMIDEKSKISGFIDYIEENFTDLSLILIEGAKLSRIKR